MSDELSPEKISIPDWKRPYKVGPSDAFLHTIGQISANYSGCEWTVHSAFQFVCGLSQQVVQDLITTTNIGLAGMTVFVVHALKTYNYSDGKAANDLATCILDFKNQSPTRHKIIHWQSEVEDGDTATYTNLIKTKQPSSPQKETWTLDELRTFALNLVEIQRPMLINLQILEGSVKRNAIDPDWLVPWSKKSAPPPKAP